MGQKRHRSMELPTTVANKPLAPIRTSSSASLLSLKVDKDKDQQPSALKPPATLLLLIGLICCLYVVARSNFFWVPQNSASRARSTGEGIQFEYGPGCNSMLNSGAWHPVAKGRCWTGQLTTAACDPALGLAWDWSEDARQCGASHVSQPALQRLLAGKWVAVAGDSIGRFIFAALLRQLTQDDSRRLVYGHQDFEYELPGSTRASFLWRPYMANLTAQMHNWTAGGEVPDVVLMSAGLWHMLHIADAAAHMEVTQAFTNATNAFVAAQADGLCRGPTATPLKCQLADVPQLHTLSIKQKQQANSTKVKGRRPATQFVSLTETVSFKLKDDLKKQHLTLQNVDQYNAVLKSSALLAPEGPCNLIDMHSLSQGCGARCTHDGLHYSNATYDAALQIWANLLRASL